MSLDYDDDDEDDKRSRRIGMMIADRRTDRGKIGKASKAKQSKAAV